MLSGVVVGSAGLIVEETIHPNSGLSADNYDVGDLSFLTDSKLVSTYY
jgi:hypothetical protein